MSKIKIDGWSRKSTQPEECENESILIRKKNIPLKSHEDENVF